MDTPQSVRETVFSINLKDAYLQGHIHPESRKHLHFVANCKVFQFKVFCFCLTTALQVFTSVMAPVLAFLHQIDIRILSYLHDWLVLVLALEDSLMVKDRVLALCEELCIRVSLVKSSLTPTQEVTYLGIILYLQL